MRVEKKNRRHKASRHSVRIDPTLTHNSRTSTPVNGHAGHNRRQSPRQLANINNYTANVFTGVSANGNLAGSTSTTALGNGVAQLSLAPNGNQAGSTGSPGLNQGINQPFGPANGNLQDFNGFSAFYQEFNLGFNQLSGPANGNIYDFTGFTAHYHGINQHSGPVNGNLSGSNDSPVRDNGDNQFPVASNGNLSGSSGSPALQGFNPLSGPTNGDLSDSNGSPQVTCPANWGQDEAQRLFLVYVAFKGVVIKGYNYGLILNFTLGRLLRELLNRPGSTLQENYNCTLDREAAALDNVKTFLMTHVVAPDTSPVTGNDAVTDNLPLTDRGVMDSIFHVHESYLRVRRAEVEFSTALHGCEMILQRVHMAPETYIPQPSASQILNRVFILQPVNDQ
jgi:hypothetical protein